jgi:hypothetical protein
MSRQSRALKNVTTCKLDTNRDIYRVLNLVDPQPVDDAPTQRSIRVVLSFDRARI